ALRSHYLKLLKSVGGIENGELDNGQAALKFLKADLSELKKTADIYRSDELNDIVFSVSNDIGVSLLGENGLINLEIVSEKYTKDELKEILKSFRKKKKFHLLHGKAIYLDAGLEAIDKTMNEGKVDLDSLESSRLPFYSAFSFLENKKVKISLNEYLTTAFENIKNFKNREVEIPDFLLDKLKPYQIDGVKYLLTLHDYHLGGVLADDMGLGKTLETIAFLSIAEIHKPLLVVCPKSLLYNWEAEVNMWNPFLPVYLIDGAKITRENAIKSIDQGNKAIYVTSYNSLRNDTDLYEGIEFEAVILDEAQYIKNAGTKNSSSVKEIKAKTHFALTGTPLENSEMDLWSIFDFLLPGYLSSRQDFKDKYLLNPLGHNSLRKKLTPFILRRRKQDVLKELPPKITEVTTISLNDDERRYYDASLQEAKELLKSNSDSFTILPLLTKLREIAVDLPSFFEGDFEESSKLAYVVDRIEEAIDTGHKILVFSSFKRVLTHLQSLLNETNIPSYFINGDTPAQERLNICDRFNAEESVKVTLVSLKAGGTGLNLHGADIVIHLDPWWNEAAENQATDRAYRIGQKRTVNVYKLIAHDTIEEKVLLLQEKKHSLYESLISNTDEALTKLTREDIIFLLS
nr:DEAD/DEAH box helicase [Bacilli bacterium]